MLTTIPAGHIGNFSSVGEKRLYDKMTEIMKPAQEMAEVFIRSDNREGDENRQVFGSVLFDTPSLSGVCQFDPETKVVQHLDAERVTTDYSHVDPDADFTWSSSGRIGPPTTREHFSIERSGDGKVTYTTERGTVTMNPDGSLYMAVE